MFDCTVTEIRDLLPDYLHDRLDATTRERVADHVAACASCASDLETLRAVRAAYAELPPVDIDAIVRHLPQPAVAPVLKVERSDAAVRPAQRPWARSRAWLRLAAAVSFLSLGGVSVWVAQRYFEGGQVGGAGVADSTVRPALTDTSVDASRGESAGATARAALSVGGGLSDLEVEDLEALLSELEQIEAAPLASPDERIGQPAGTRGVS